MNFQLLIKTKKNEKDLIFCFKLLRYMNHVFILLINVKMPSVVVVEHEKCFIPCVSGSLPEASQIG